MNGNGHSYQPSNSEVGHVRFQPGSHKSWFEASRDFKAGETIAPLTGLKFGMPKKWSSVQFAENDHFELCSDFVYLNHSCEPNVAMKIVEKREEWRLEALKDIRSGHSLTFFYPSTEWKMDQPFECECGGKACLKTISGASDLSVKAIEQRGFVAPHILELFNRQERDSAQA